MMPAAAELASENRLKKAAIFRRNAYLIIQEMMKLSAGPPPRRTDLVDEVLHSILFLGHINNPRCTPEKILDDKFNEYMGRYPHPFECYSTQLPKRAPISCVLEMIVYVTGQENEDEIYKELLTLINDLKETKIQYLVSNTFCVSRPNKSPKSARYYGVSMSTSGPNPGRIMVAASCLRYWDEYVAGAVMTYYPNKQKEYFDGTIKLPEEVRCQAIGLSEEKKKMDPCKACSDLFGLTTSAIKLWAYGNCAEPESLSNLLQNEKEVKEKAKPKSEKNRERAEREVLKVLKDTLRMLQFKWDEKFYTPQVKS